MRHFIALSTLSTLTAVAHCSQAPAPTSPPEYPVEHHLEIRQTTSYYSLVTTEIPKDEFSIGMGQNGTGGNYYWVYCIDEPLLVTSGFAGCGTDDIYTSCRGRTAFGFDGQEILCDRQCVTHKIYQDLDVTGFTPLLGCGRGTSTMNLLRTSTHSGQVATTTEDSPATTTAAETTRNAGAELRPYSQLAYSAALICAMAMILY